MNRWLLHCKIISSALVWASAGIAAFLIAAAFLLDRLRFVESVQLVHMTAFFELMLPLAAILIMSQLFAEEMEPGIPQWLMSLPTRNGMLVLQRWGIGTVLLLVLYAVSALIVHIGVIPIPLGSFTLEMLPPALWLGNLAMLATLAFRSYVGGLSAPLLYWLLELLSRGGITQRYYLFAATFTDRSSLYSNRFALLAMSFLALLISVWLFSRRSYFTAQKK